jgi:DNA repair exonuclease SbcCD ATPase subunit
MIKILRSLLMLSVVSVKAWGMNETTQANTEEADEPQPVMKNVVDNDGSSEEDKGPDQRYAIMNYGVPRTRRNSADSFAPPKEWQDGCGRFVENTPLKQIEKLSEENQVPFPGSYGNPLGNAYSTPGYYGKPLSYQAYPQGQRRGGGGVVKDLAKMNKDLLTINRNQGGINYKLYQNIADLKQSIFGLQAEIKGKDVEIEGLNKLLKEKDKNSKRSIQDWEKMEDALKKKEGELGKAQQKLQSANEKNEELRNKAFEQKKSYEQQLTNQKEEYEKIIQGLSKEILDLQSGLELKRLQDIISDREKEKSEMVKKYDQLMTKYDQAQKALENSEKDKEIARLREKNESLEALLNSFDPYGRIGNTEKNLASQLSQVEQANENYLKEIQRLQKNLEDANQKNRNLFWQIATLQKDGEEKADTKQKLSGSIDTLQNNLKSLQEERDTIKSERDRLNGQLKALKEESKNDGNSGSGKKISASKQPEQKELLRLTKECERVSAQWLKERAQFFMKAGAFEDVLGDLQAIRQHMEENNMKDPTVSTNLPEQQEKFLKKWKEIPGIKTLNVSQLSVDDIVYFIREYYAPVYLWVVNKDNLTPLEQMTYPDPLTVLNFSKDQIKETLNEVKVFQIQNLTESLESISKEDLQLQLFWDLDVRVNEYNAFMQALQELRETNIDLYGKIKKYFGVKDAFDFIKFK